MACCWIGVGVAVALGRDGAEERLDELEIGNCMDIGLVESPS